MPLPEEYTVAMLVDMRTHHSKTVEHKVYNVSQDTLDDALFQLLKSDWEPYLEPTVEHLNAEMENTRMGQQGLNRRSFQISELLDATLYIVTVKALANASLTDRRRLLREHYEWDERRRAAAEEARLPMEGGTAAPLLYSDAYNAITEERIARVRHQYLKKG